MTNRYALHTYTYELGADNAWILVVEHVFYGPTPERAKEIYAAHLKTDAFLSSCVTGRFKDITCRTVVGTPEPML